MRALTLLRPWAYCIAHLDKRIENRTWAPWKAVIGQRIAIHSGKGIDVAGMKWLHREGLITLPLPEDAHLAGFIVATAIVDGYVQTSNDKWFAGPYGWVLRDVDVLPCALSCRGAQGLWTVPPAIERWIVPERRCAGFGVHTGKCTNRAGCEWTPYWCERCNDLRMNHISSQLIDIATGMES